MSNPNIDNGALFWAANLKNLNVASIDLLFRASKFPDIREFYQLSQLTVQIPKYTHPPHTSVRGHVLNALTLTFLCSNLIFTLS